MKNYSLYIAMFLLVLCLPFRGNANEVKWLWEDMPWIPWILIFASLNLIAQFVYRRELKSGKEVIQANKKVGH